MLGFQEIVPSKFERTAGLRELTPAEPYPKPQPESQIFCGNMMEGGAVLCLCCFVTERKSSSSVQKRQGL